MLRNFTFVRGACRLRSAYLLVSHGSRDARPQRAIAKLADRLQSRLSAPVGTAVLECAPMPLHQQIEQFSDRHPSVSQIQIVPLFLLPGVHVMEDIPEQIAQARTRAKLQVLPHFGCYAGLKDLLTDRFSTVAADARILLAHGSRRSGGNTPIESLAASIDALPAYWLVAPSLSDRIEELNQQGHQKIAVLPYFLFSGGITDAIARSVQQSVQSANLQLLSPFDFSEELVSAIESFIALQAPAELILH